MRTPHLKVLIDLVASYGVSQAKLLVGSNLSPQQLKEDQLLSTELSYTLCERAVELTEDRALGFKYGSRLGIHTHGVLGQILQSSQDLRQAVQLLITYYRLVMPSVPLELIRVDGRDCLFANFIEVIPGAPHFFTESFFAAVQGAARCLVREPLPSLLRFNYPAPSYVNLYEQWFDPRLEFSAEQTALHFYEDTLSLKLESASPAALAIFRRQCDTLLGHTITRQYSDKIRDRLLKCSNGFPKLPEMANQLATSERSLRRKLVQEGTSYRQLIEESRSILACDLLRNSQLTIADIGRQLGYDDVANFRRAFVRWHKHTPSDYRQNVTINTP
mgnify:CR=1 FL=1